jgi:hypothetical protein
MLPKNLSKKANPNLSNFANIVIAISANCITLDNTYMGNPTGQAAVPYKANVYFQSAGSVVIDSAILER